MIVIPVSLPGPSMVNGAVVVVIPRFCHDIVGINVRLNSKILVSCAASGLSADTRFHHQRVSRSSGNGQKHALVSPQSPTFANRCVPAGNNTGVRLSRPESAMLILIRLEFSNTARGLSGAVFGSWE